MKWKIAIIIGLVLLATACESGSGRLDRFEGYCEEKEMEYYSKTLFIPSNQYSCVDKTKEIHTFSNLEDKCK